MAKLPYPMNNGLQASREKKAIKEKRAIKEILALQALWAELLKYVQ